MRWSTQKPSSHTRLDLAIEEAVKSTPARMRAVIEALQALRGIAQVAAVTIIDVVLPSSDAGVRAGVVNTIW